MRFEYSAQTDSGFKIVALSERQLADEVRRLSDKTGYPVVATVDADTIVMSSITDLGADARLDARHTTQFRADITERTEPTQQEEELINKPFYPDPYDESVVFYQIEIPPFSSLIDSLHSNDSTVTAPISDEDARDTIVTHHQDILINYDVLLSQSLYGDFYDGAGDAYENLYSNVAAFDATLADIVFRDAELAETQIDASSASHANSWQDLFTIPYSAYKEALFASYYSDLYSFNRPHSHMMWAQTELYDGPIELAQCRKCGCVRSPARLDSNSVCQ